MHCWEFFSLLRIYTKSRRNDIIRCRYTVGPKKHEYSVLWHQKVGRYMCFLEIFKRVFFTELPTLFSLLPPPFSPKVMQKTIKKASTCTNVKKRRKGSARNHISLALGLCLFYHAVMSDYLTDESKKVPI
jgi:hypothetical protein